MRENHISLITGMCFSIGLSLGLFVMFCVLELYIGSIAWFGVSLTGIVFIGSSLSAIWKLKTYFSGLDDN